MAMYAGALSDLLRAGLLTGQNGFEGSFLTGSGAGDGFREFVHAHTNAATQPICHQHDAPPVLVVGGNTISAVAPDNTAPVALKATAEPLAVAVDFDQWRAA
jgi:hypothetical protein